MLVKGVPGYEGRFKLTLDNTNTLKAINDWYCYDLF